MDVYSEPADSWDSVHLAGVNQGQGIPVDKRQHDQAHGIPASPDGTRTEFLPGHSSLHFGRGHVNGDPRSYDYHGGAYGTVISNEFSLAGKSYADQPKLYFNYFKEGEVNPTSGTSIDHAVMYISDNNYKIKIRAKEKSTTHISIEGQASNLLQAISFEVTNDN